MDGSFLGLGYFHYREDDRRQHGAGRGDDPQQEGAVVSHSEQNAQLLAVDDYMNQYLQQCLRYHEEQEFHRRKGQNLDPASETEGQQVHVISSIHARAAGSSTSNEPVYFVSGGVVSGGADQDLDESVSAMMKVDRHKTKRLGHPENESQSTMQVEHIAQQAETSVRSTDATASAIHISAAEGRKRAQEILSRFRQQRDHLLYQSLGGQEKQKQVEIPQTQPYMVLEEPPEPSVFLEQRRRGMQREIRIKRQAMLRNLEYVVEKEHARSRSLQDEISHARLLEEQANAQYQAATSLRKQKILDSSLLTTQAGIGTNTRKNVERIKEQTGNVPRGAQESTQLVTVALYISGLPTDGSVTSAFVENLFASFGTIEKVHFYQNKKTRQPKGDGLVIYKLGERLCGKKEQTDLIETVCSQMNGAELPCGLKLKVEPSVSNKKQMSQHTALQLSAKHDKEPNQNETKKEEIGVGDNDEELDDFFSSL